MPRDKMPGYRQEIENIPHADDSEKEIKELLKKLRVFREEELAVVLHDLATTSPSATASTRTR
ncbi:MAG: hypothetical protein WKG07_29490 [Hymenobacter sp.]